MHSERKILFPRGRAQKWVCVLSGHSKLKWWMPKATSEETIVLFTSVDFEYKRFTKGKLPIEPFSMIISKQSPFSSLKGNQYTIFFSRWRDLRRHQLRYFLYLLILATDVKEMYDNNKKIHWRVVYWFAYFDQIRPPSFLLTSVTEQKKNCLLFCRTNHIVFFSVI